MRALVAAWFARVQGFEKKLSLSALAIERRPRATSSTCRWVFASDRPPDAAGVKCETDPDRDPDQGLGQAEGWQVAAEVRGYKPPEPYKGKGVRYADEP